MKRCYFFIILLLMAVVSLPSDAQRTKRKKPKSVKKVKVVKQEEPAEEHPLTAQMLAATERVLFVDSIVVTREKMLSAISTNPEEGSIKTYNEFFGTKSQPDGFVYVNELRNHCILSKADKHGRMHLYSSDLIGSNWSDPTPLKGLDDGTFTDMNYPYLMTDGVTLYFAAKGSQSLGGYDIYRTRLDSETGKYLKPQNIGMPFCSADNDAFYVIDEQNRLGYFVTDRRQPDGKVCVYTFVPNDSRPVYNADQLTPEQIRSMARIDRIADTWGNGQEHKNALARKSEIRKKNSSDRQTASFSFVINDDVTYTQFSQFSRPQLFRELLSWQSQAEELKSSLLKARDFYIKASAGYRKQMEKEITDNERKYEEFLIRIHQREKEIRKIENERKKQRL